MLTCERNERCTWQIEKHLLHLLHDYTQIQLNSSSISTTSLSYCDNLLLEMLKYCCANIKIHKHNVKYLINPTTRKISNQLSENVIF